MRGDLPGGRFSGAYLFCGQGLRPNFFLVNFPIRLDCFLGRNTLLGPPSTFHSCNWQNENMAKLSNLSGEFLQMNANEAYSIYRRMLNESMASPASLRCQAEALNRRALAGHEAHLGANHPRTLTSMNILAMLLRQQGKLAEAGRRSLG